MTTHANHDLAAMGFALALVLILWLSPSLND